MKSGDNNFETNVLSVVRKYLESYAFTQRKITDMPKDSLSVVNREFVTLNGATASRPTSSILGQFYFDTSVGKPVYWNGTTWVDSTGTPA